MADMDPNSVSKLRVVDLREHLSKRGLSTSGLKAELVKRLKEALEEEQGEISVIFLYTCSVLSAALCTL